MGGFEIFAVGAAGFVLVMLRSSELLSVEESYNKMRGLLYDGTITGGSEVGQPANDTTGGDL